MEAAVKSASPVRTGTIEVRSSVLIENGEGLIMVPLGSYPVASSEVEKSVSLTARSTGSDPITVEGISLYWRIGGDPKLESKLMGRDDYIGKNPRLPTRIEAGESATWMFALATFAWFYTAHKSQGHEVTHFRFDVDLGDGEVLKSDVYEMDLVRPEALTPSGGPIGRRDAYRMVARIAKAAAIPRHISPHSLRHAAITNALDAGVPLRDAQILARHADPRTTEHYDRARQPRPTRSPVPHRLRRGHLARGVARRRPAHYDAGRAGRLGAQARP